MRYYLYMINTPYPCIWCNNNAREVAEFYGSLFPDAKTSHPNEIVSNVSFLDFKIMLLNGGLLFKPNQAISFVIECDTQEEIDYYWDNLSRGGNTSQCGWLTDKFGVSWQIVPKILGTLMSHPDKQQKTMEAFQSMTKFIIADLEQL